MKILVVEDQHLLATSIKKGLHQEKHVVDVANTGTDGLDMALSESYNLIILDLMLPGVDGLTICKKIREQNIHTPILMLTARSQIEDKVAGLDSGADDYLTKPFSFAELLARIRALSRRPQKADNAILAFGTIQMDLQKIAVTRNGKIIILSYKEFALLEYLLRHPNQVLTKDQIIANVWDYSANVLPNTVEVYIKALRQKLGEPNVIQTARGFGYKLSDV